LIGLRLISWVLVLASAGWLFAGALRPVWEPLTQHLPMPAMASEELSGTVIGPELPAMATAPAPGDGSGIVELTSPVAKLPYDQLYPLLLTRDRVSDLGRLSAMVLLRSSENAMQNGHPASAMTNEVVLTLDDGDEQHEYRLGEYGQLDLPAREDWLERGLWVVSNQPPDSLQLSISLMVERLPADQVEYRWLVETADQIEDALDSLAGGEAPATRQVQGLTFLYGPGQKGAVRVLSERFGGEYFSDPSGRIRFPFQEELRDENPMVQFSPRPARMTPLTR
jgi:hypothetical protein